MPAIWSRMAKTPRLCPSSNSAGERSRR